MTKLAELTDELTKVCKEGKTEAERYLREFLAKRNTYKIDFREYSYENGSVGCVSYDGGSHPEYASNVFSEVYGVCLDKKDTLCLIIDDCDKYEIDRVDASELIWIAFEIESQEDSIFEFLDENKSED